MLEQLLLRPLLWHTFSHSFQDVFLLTIFGLRQPSLLTIASHFPDLYNLTWGIPWGNIWLRSWSCRFSTFSGSPLVRFVFQDSKLYHVHQYLVAALGGLWQQILSFIFNAVGHPPCYFGNFYDAKCRSYCNPSTSFLSFSDACSYVFM